MLNDVAGAFMDVGSRKKITLAQSRVLLKRVTSNAVTRKPGTGKHFPRVKIRERRKLKFKKE